MNIGKKTGIKTKIFDGACERSGFTTAQKEKWKQYGNKVGMFIWGIGKFITMLWLSTKMVSRVGFETTTITYLLTIAFLLRANLKKPLIE